MSRRLLLVVVGGVGLILGISLLGAGLAAARGTQDPSPTPPVSKAGAVATPYEGRFSLPSEAAKAAAGTLSGQELADAQAAAEAYVTQVSGDSGTVVCLTSQNLIGVVVNADRPVDAKPLTAEQRQASCDDLLVGSHAAS